MDLRHISRNLWRAAAFSLLALAVSCGGGGGGDSTGTSTASPLAVPSGMSAAEAIPGEFITITDSSIQEGVASTITFTDSNKYTVSFETVQTSAGRTRVAVPLYLNPDTGKVDEKDVAILVNGKALPKGFHIEKPLEIGNAGGEVVVKVLQKALAENQAARSSLAAIGIELAVSLDYPASRLEDSAAEIQAWINQIQTTHTLTLPYGTGTRMLTREDLKVADQWLACTYLGIRGEIEASAGFTKEGIDPEKWLKLTPEEKLQQVKDGIDYVVKEVKRGMEGDKALMGGMAVGGAVAGWIVGGPVGAPIGAAMGLALGYFSASYELGTEAAYHRLCQSFSEKNIQEDYDLAKTALKQAALIGLKFVGGVEDKVGEFVHKALVAYEGYETVEDLEKTRCEGENSKAPGTVEDFCDDLGAPEAVVTHMSATVSFPGYLSRSFASTSSAAVFDSSSNGDPLLARIPTMVGTVGPLDITTIISQEVLWVSIRPGLTYAFPCALGLDGTWLQDGGLGDVTYSTPEIMDEDGSGRPVAFEAVDGTIYVTSYGTKAGDVMRGSFDVDMEGTLNHGNGSWTMVTGRVTGTFEGVLSDSNPLIQH
jgi:hypothetical protein